jgi:hypothetical protein
MSRALVDHYTCDACRKTSIAPAGWVHVGCSDPKFSMNDARSRDFCLSCVESGPLDKAVETFKRAAQAVPERLR